jgi:hypothetical protein
MPSPQMPLLPLARIVMLGLSDAALEIFSALRVLGATEIISTLEVVHTLITEFARGLLLLLLPS